MNPALYKEDVEFFIDEEARLRVLTNGKAVLFKNAPARIHQILLQELDSDHKASTALKELGLRGMPAIEKLARCRYGTFSDTPDIANGKHEPEHIHCEIRGMCPAEGRLCLTISTPEGHLTPRELEIVALTAIDLSDKMIADRLKISELTVRTHMDNIRRKLQVSTRVGIAVFACKKNIT